MEASVPELGDLLTGPWLPHYSAISSCLLCPLMSFPEKDRSRVVPLGSQLFQSPVAGKAGHIIDAWLLDPCLGVCASRVCSRCGRGCNGGGGCCGRGGWFSGLCGCTDIPRGPPPTHFSFRGMETSVLHAFNNMLLSTPSLDLVF